MSRSPIRWEPVPGFPGYEINPRAHVRNARRYVVAHERGATLVVSGRRVSLTRKDLVALAAEAFKARPLPAYLLVDPAPYMAASRAPTEEGPK